MTGMGEGYIRNQRKSGNEMWDRPPLFRPVGVEITPRQIRFYVFSASDDDDIASGAALHPNKMVD